MNKGTSDDKISAIVKDFFHHITIDDKLKEFFSQFDQKRIEHHPSTFYSHSFGDETYSREEISKAHQHMNIDGEHFESMIDHFIQSLHSQGFGEEDKQKAKEHLLSYKNEVLGNTQH
ncbi:globin domain-containing protein [Robertmurraya sp. FSL R5-0851]|uniref:globin domain-containing protein n=1 Tax=Robertmurraya sp. FSL R5-0851 TaxID=2921584 RepID=UPI0030F6CB4C